MLILIQSKNLLLGIMPESIGMFLFGAVMILIAVGLRKVLGQDDENFSSEEPVKILSGDSTNGLETANVSLSVNEK